MTKYMTRGETASHKARERMRMLRGEGVSPVAGRDIRGRCLDHGTPRDQACRGCGYHVCSCKEHPLRRAFEALDNIQRLLIDDALSPSGFATNVFESAFRPNAKRMNEIRDSLVGPAPELRAGINNDPGPLTLLALERTAELLQWKAPQHNPVWVTVWSEPHDGPPVATVPRDEIEALPNILDLILSRPIAGRTGDADG